MAAKNEPTISAKTVDRFNKLKSQFDNLHPDIQKSIETIEDRFGYTYCIHRQLTTANGSAVLYVESGDDNLDKIILEEKHLVVVNKSETHIYPFYKGEVCPFSIINVKKE